MATRPAMQLIRLVGGLALLAAAPLQLGATVIDPDTFDSRPLVNPLETPSHVLYWVAYLLTIVGLPAVHELQATRVGRVGAAGFLLALAGSALTMAISIIVAYLLPLLASSTGGAANLTLLVMPGSVLAPLLPVLVLVAVTFFPGFILLGVATARAGVFPSWSRCDVSSVRGTAWSACHGGRLPPACSRPRGLQLETPPPLPTSRVGYELSDCRPTLKVRRGSWQVHKHLGESFGNVRFISTVAFKGLRAHLEGHSY